MQKFFALLLIFPLLLCGGCQKEESAPETEIPVVSAQGAAYTQEVTETTEREDAFQGFPLNPKPTESQEGEIPIPEPVTPTSAAE